MKIALTLLQKNIKIALTLLQNSIKIALTLLQNPVCFEFKPIFEVRNYLKIIFPVLFETINSPSSTTISPFLITISANPLVLNPSNISKSQF